MDAKPLTINKYEKDRLESMEKNSEDELDKEDKERHHLTRNR